jgi:hypothetical protein
MARRPEKIVESRISLHSKKAAAKPVVVEESSEAPPRLAKSADPAYTKFTTYIRKSTHLEVKTRLVSMEKELSDLVEELLTEWLEKQ